MAGASGISSKGGSKTAKGTQKATVKAPSSVRPTKDLSRASPSEFAGAVKDEARALAASGNKNQRFGNKVFISALHERIGGKMPLDTFKSKLWEAHQSGLLSLNRADMVEAMPARAVDKSQVNLFNGRVQYHFVRVDS